MYFLVHNEWLIQKIKMTSLYVQSLLYKLFQFIIIIYYYYYNLFVYFIYKNHRVEIIIIFHFYLII